MVGHTLTKPADILALGQLYQRARDLESRQEYFLRLLDYFEFSKPRLVGMKRTDIEAVFGAGKQDRLQDDENPKATVLQWRGGRDYLSITFVGEIATKADYVMGY